MKKLHEIISQEAKKFSAPITPEGFNLLIQNVAIEFAKHILEEAAENAEMMEVGNKKFLVKNSITDTINKYL